MVDRLLITEYNIQKYEFHDFHDDNADFLNYHIQHSSSGCCIATYLIIDTPNHNAFGHWTFESAIILPYIQKLLNHYPNLKIVCNHSNPYKELYLTFFNIEKERIVDTIQYTHNICLFPNLSECSLNLKSNTNIYENALVNFDKYFDRNQQKIYEKILLTRHQQNNYKLFERTVDTSDIQTHLSSNDLVLDTSVLQTLREQIDYIQRSKIIIVPDGSAFLVNGFFARESIIIVLSGHVLSCSQAVVCTPRLKYIINRIRQNNLIVYIANPAINWHHQTFTYDNIKQILEEGICSHQLSKNIFIHAIGDLSKVCQIPYDELKKRWID